MSWNGNTLHITLLALCEGNPPVTSGFPSQKASNAELSCLLDVSLYELFSKQLSCQLSDMPHYSYDTIVMILESTHSIKVQNTKVCITCVGWSHKYFCPLNLFNFILTHWDLSRMAAILQKTISSVCYWMKILVFLLKFHSSLLLRV